MKTVTVLFLIISIMYCSGCGSTVTGTRSFDPVAYVKIKGTKNGQIVVLDDLPAKVIFKSNENELIQVTPGKHRIRITQQDKILVDRIIYVSDAQTLEIIIPAL